MSTSLLTIDQLADRLQLRRETLFRWMHNGRFPLGVLRLGRARRVRSAEFDAWVSAGCPAGRDKWQWKS